MFSFRVLFSFRSVPRTIKCIAKQRTNVRLFTSTVTDLELHILYPNSDKKLAKYLDHLSEKTTDPNVNEIRRKYAMRKSFVQQLTELENEMKNESDAEILKLALDEKQSFIDRLAYIDKDLINEVLVLNSDEFPHAVVLEVRAGVGGKEAALFTSELHSMYLNYLAYKGFEHNPLEEDVSELGGLRHASIIVRDADAFLTLVHEAGVHRVQRIPKTEKAGRIHTSTAIVAVVPCPDDLEININPKDLQIETKRSSGPGGQNVNKLESAVRIVHIPSGISVECQEERTQIKNKKIAMRKLYAKLYQIELKRQRSSIDSTRKSQVGSGVGLRNEKLRTYNYNQNRVSDHRLPGSEGTLHNLDEFLNGGEPLDELIQKLRAMHNSMQLAEIVKDF